MALLKFCGKVKEITGSLIISEGPFAKLGDICRIYKSDKTYIDCEVIGFRNQDVLISAYGSVNGITFGNMVYSFDKPLSIMCSDKLLGNILDGMGKPLNGCVHKFYETPISIHHRAVRSLQIRHRIKEHIQTGIRALDGVFNGWKRAENGNNERNGSRKIYSFVNDCLEIQTPM